MMMTGGQPLHIRVPSRDKIIKENFHQQIWPELTGYLDRLFNDPNSFDINLCDNAYAIVYNICISGLMSNCFKNLMEYISDYLCSIKGKLCSSNDEDFLQILTNILNNHNEIITNICVIFRYLDRNYIHHKFKQPFQEKLKNEWGEKIVRSKEVKERLAVILSRDCFGCSWNFCDSNSPFAPSNLQKLIKGLHSFSVEYQYLNQSLFSLYIPCLKASDPLEIEQMNIVKEHQRLMNIGIQKGQENKKRKEMFSC